MKTIWKWILGILIAVLVVGAFFAAGFLLMRAGRVERAYMGGGMPFHHGWNAGPMMRGDDFGPQAGPMMRGERGFGRGFGGFFFLGGIGWLLRLAFFGLLIYGAYWLGRRNARVVVDPRTPAPAVPAPEPPAEQSPPAQE